MPFKKLFDWSQPLVAATTILVVALFIMLLYAVQVVYDVVLANDTVAVTGSAKEAVTADVGRLVINIETQTGISDQEQGTKRLQKAVDDITAYLASVELTDFETPAGYINTTYYYPERSTPVLTGYSINRSVVVRSDKLAALQSLANDPSPLTGDGFTVTTGGLELTYSKLDEMRVKLLTKAIDDATLRAEAIAAPAGREVGLLRNATGGVVQVLPAQGVDISDYGSYDTSSLEKEVMVTVRATFALE